MERGTYTVYSWRKTPTRKRAIKVRGTFEDRDKYIRCWNCGFMVNTERDLGGSEETGNYETDAIVQTTQRVGSGDQATVMLGIELFGDIGVIISTGALGSIPDCNKYTPRNASVSTGCPLCGVTNLG